MAFGWGIDVGVASLGFAVIELDEAGNPKALIDGVSMVYSAPTGAADRTRYKSLRTQNQRGSRRTKTLRKELAVLLGLAETFDTDLPCWKDGSKANGEVRHNNSRIRLRVHGLSEPLSPGDLARAILHIAKNRGQRLTRGLKTPEKPETAEGKNAEKERKTTAAQARVTTDDLAVLGRQLGLNGPAHPSQLLARRSGRSGSTRLKKDRKDMPVFTRQQVVSELMALLRKQQGSHEALTETVQERLLAEVFYEHEAKKPKIGKCRYGLVDVENNIEPRLARGTDLFQTKRIYEEVNNLRLISARTAAEAPLTEKQRRQLAALLLDGHDLSASRVAKELSIGTDALADRTSLDIKKRGRKTEGKLLGHPLAAAMRNAGALAHWQSLSMAQREQIAALVRTEDDSEVLVARLDEMGISVDAAKRLSETRLPATYSAAGETATRRLLEALQHGAGSNYEAEQIAGLKPLDPAPRRLDRLPYYGEILPLSCVGGSEDPGERDEIRWGRIPNPVVHVALNRIRQVANRYLDLYGKPARICIELARDLNKSEEDRERAEKEAKRNRDRNEKYIKSLVEDKRRLTRSDLQKIKLHDMQGGECLYTGEVISKGNLFDGTVEVDHILPWAVTRDDGISNLALVKKRANQHKKNRAPFMAFHPSYEGQDYETLLKRARKRGIGVYWRFGKDALDRFKDQDAFQARLLNDTRYVGKMAARYLACVSTDPNAVVCLNGRITSTLRHEWGLSTLIRDIMVQDGRLALEDVKRPEGGETYEELQARRSRVDKIRWDHRHHLLDAIVAACVTRSDVQRIQTLAGRESTSLDTRARSAEIRETESLHKSGGICWLEGFRGRVEAFLNARGTDDGPRPFTAVVPRADHDPRGQLHNESQYGVICEVVGQPGRYVARLHARIDELDWKKIQSLGVPDSALTAVEAAMAAGGSFWWGGSDPLSSLRDNLAPELVRLKSRLLALMEETPAEALAKASTESGRGAARAKWATDCYIKETGQRRFTRIEVLSLRILKGPDRHDTRPKRAYQTDANDRLVYFVNGDGERDWEVVSVIDANTPSFRERWRRDGGRSLFTLRKNDLVEMNSDPRDGAAPRRLYRTVSFSGAGRTVDIEFLPVEEARAPKEVPKATRLRIRSLGAFKARAPAMVLCDPTGRVRWRGPRLN